jgi:hypothetical protein
MKEDAHYSRRAASLGSHEPSGTNVSGVHLFTFAREGHSAKAGSGGLLTGRDVIGYRL